MCTDEVVAGERLKGAGVGAGYGQARARVEASDARGEQAEHGGRSVDGIGMEIRSYGQQASQKAAVAIAENESTVAMRDRGDVVEAATLEYGPKREIFRRAVKAGDAVEAGGGLGERVKGALCIAYFGKLLYGCHGSTKRSGVRRIASAATRSASRKLVIVAGSGLRDVLWRCS